MTEYRDNLEGITKGNLNGFFEDWGNKPSANKHFAVLQNSDYVILAIDEGKVIGFINAITDKTLSAYIPLLEVLPGYRNKGIGTELVKRMLEKLKDFYMIDLCCDDKLVGYYEKTGMSKVSGMILRHYDKI
jgi:ribosomal protein S18 acetylase RimI-like enzyme